MPLDEHRQWFRYHSLFAQVLGGYLRRTDPEVVPVLHERASAWHRQWGSVDEAIEHALAGGDHAGAIGLVASHWFAYVDSGRLVTLRSWIGSLDSSAIDADPVAAHCAAWPRPWPATGSSSGTVFRSWKQPTGRSRCRTACGR